MTPLSFTFFALLFLMPRHETLPDVTGFYPGWGYPGQIIKVEGTDLGHPSIYFDGRVIPSASSSGIYFQIPRDATEDRHSIQLRYGFSGSGVHHLEVRPLRAPWPRQRIEDIAINTMTRDLRVIKLAVSVANADPDSRVNVSTLDDVGPLPLCNPCTSELLSALPSDFFNRDVNNPSTYGYPVYHYGSLLVTIPTTIGMPATSIMGRTLIVEVINRDGSSSKKEYTMPVGYIQLDSDNDGLWDMWEISGYPRPSDPEHIIDLRAMGCDPYRKDILVEVDWMPSALPASFISTGNIWDRISEVYQNAPVLNPDGSSGIHLHIDHGQDRGVPPGSPSTGPFDQGNEGVEIPDFDYIDFRRDRPSFLTATETYINFCTFKSSWFDPDRNDIFHYCVIGNAGGNRGSGRAESPGNGFIVTTVRLPNPEVARSVDAMIGSFVHELGHNLGLHHGGLITDPPFYFTSRTPYDWQPYVLDLYKPNQPSSMNYRYHLKGISQDCDLCPDVPAVHGYSQGMMRDVNERMVSEMAGICNSRSIDFVDGIIESAPANTNGVSSLCIRREARMDDDTDNTDVFHDFNEWGNLKLNWRSSRLFRSPPSWWWGCR